MKLTTQVEEAKNLLEESIEHLDEQDVKIQALADDTPDEEREFHKGLFQKYQEDVARRRETLERLIAITRARQTIPPLEDEEEQPGDGGNGGEIARRVRVAVGEEPHTYRRDNSDKISFFGDILAARKGDPLAADRLAKHQRETRDVTTADPGAGVFVPPVYLDEMWAELPREGRPFADVLPKMPLPPAGNVIEIPRITTGTAVAVQTSEASAVQETDIDGTLLSVNVRTIAGQNDVSLQALERTAPGLDFLIFQDLRADYDEQLDTQCISGTGASGQHLGINAVTGINTVTYTDASPTAAEFVPKIYDGVQQIAAGRFRRADTILLHPRRAAWMASNLSSTFPLFQLGVLNQAAGTQQAGFVDNFAGLRVVVDANISTTIATDQDEVLIVRAADLFLMEGPLRVRVFEDVLSGTLQVRLQVVAYSAFVSGRQPEAIARIRGTGLAAPTF
jgi:HK97 family phage major capsid protein